MDSTDKEKVNDQSKTMEIPVWVDGTQKWVTGLTKRTTCDDVIYALLYNDSKHDHDSTDRYTIYERWRDVERPLQARTKILKIWRAWGAEQCNVQLTMKHNDEPDYFGEFLHQRRRHRRTKHRSRTDKHSKSKSGSTEHRSTSERLKYMEQYAKLVINQERKLHEIGYRIQDTDKRIDTMETNLHFSRVEQNGEDYLQNTYLDNGLEDSMDEFLRNVDPDNLEMYIQFCEKVISLEDKIQQETSRIEDLSYQIRECSFSYDCHRNTSNYVNTNEECLESELLSLQAELTRMVSANMMQKYEAAEISKQIDQCDVSLANKLELINQLQKDLEETESVNGESNYENVVPEVEYDLDKALEGQGCSNAKSTSMVDEQAEYVNIESIMGLSGACDVNTSSDTRDTGKGDSFDSSDSQKKNTSDLEDSFSLDNENTSNDSQLGNSPPGVRFSSPLVTYCREISCSSPLPDYANITSSSPIGGYTDIKHIPNKLSFERLPPYPEGTAYRNDDLISERIKTEIYAYKSKRVYYTDKLPSYGSHMKYSKTSEDNDSNSDTGLSSMHSDESQSYLETLV